MERYEYRPSGVCSRQIFLELDGNTIQSVKFIGGCSGNLQGIGALIRGMNIHEAIDRLKGIKCGMKPTSCPDQLSRALEAALKNKQS